MRYITLSQSEVASVVSALRDLEQFALADKIERLPKNRKGPLYAVVEWGYVHAVALSEPEAAACMRRIQDREPWARLSVQPTPWADEEEDQ